MGSVFYFDWEVNLIQWLQKNMGAFGEKAAQVFSTIGGELVTLLVLILVLFCYKKEVGKRCSIAIVAAGMWFPMIKNIVLRIRPYLAHEEIKALQIVEKDAPADDIIQQGFSFPSGHSATSAAVYGSIALEVRKRWMWFIAVAVPLLIGLSRFAVGVHYPTDVLAGWAVGILAVGFGWLLNNKVEKEWVRYAILMAVTVPGIFWCTSRDYFTSLGLLLGMVISFLYEGKYVRFEDTRNIWAMILRVVGALGIYLALNKVLKMPFSSEFLNSGTLGANLIRTLRYTIIIFVIIGLFPRLFPLFEKIGVKKQ